MFEKIAITREWTLIEMDATHASFQNAGQMSCYVNYTADSNTAPIDEIGFLYDHAHGEHNVPIVDLTYVPDATAIWARTISRNSGSVIVEFTAITEVDTGYIMEDYVDEDYVE